MALCKSGAVIKSAKAHGLAVSTNGTSETIAGYAIVASIVRRSSSVTDHG